MLIALCRCSNDKTTVFPFSHVLPQGKGYMKTYWLKGKKDLSFKTPAELRYSVEPKESEDLSSNGWVDMGKAVFT